MTSSVPRVTANLRQMAARGSTSRRWCSNPGVKSGMPILYDNPKEVGADRIANAVGAYDLYGGPCIVVDFGTATTFDAISADGRVPGRRDHPRRRDRLDALFGHAAACAGWSWSSRGA